MLAELLLCLTGTTSPLLNLSEDVWKFLSKYCHPGEEDIIKRLLKIADKYKRINEFIIGYRYITASSKIKNNEELKLKPGIYLETLCIGLEDSCKSYLNTIAEIYDQLEKSENIDINLMLHNIENHTTLLNLLSEIIENVEQEKLHGCKILELLYSPKWTDAEKEITLNLVKIVNRKFYDQLERWLLFGQLSDTYKEFFIEDKNANKQSEKIYCNFCINKFLLPNFIKIETANYILNIGRTVYMIVNDPRKTYSQNKKDVGDLWTEAMKYEHQLHKLHESTFNRDELNHIIEPYNKFITDRFWKMIVEEGKLINHLRVIREYILMSRGDLFDEFVHHIKYVFHKKISDITEQTLNRIFERSYYKVYPPSDSIPEGLELYFDSKDPDEGIKHTLKIRYSVPWPLQVIFYEDIIKAYGSLFHLLLRIKNVQINLNQLWLHHMKGANKSFLDKKLCKLRNKCSYLIDNLQYYLQVDVIEYRYNNMMQTVKNSNEILNIFKAHEDFISIIMEESFLHNPINNKDEFEKSKNTISLTLYLLIDIIEQFSTNATIWISPLNEQQKQEVESYNEKINDLLFCLYNLCNEFQVQKVDTGKRLSYLLSRFSLVSWLKMAPKKTILKESLI